jgi:hypothetical protein
VADGLRTVALACAGRTVEQDVRVASHELTRSEIKDGLPADSTVEVPVKVGQRLLIASLRCACATVDSSIITDAALVLYEQLEELGMGQSIGRGLLQPHIE